jgi:hypothetical protein
MDVVVDSMIFDAPYGERIHVGHNATDNPSEGCFERDLDYDHWTSDDVFEHVRAWSERTRGWYVPLTSHDLIPHFEQALAEAGRYTFAPVPYVDFGKAPRVVGDGPASWSCYLLPSRPRSKAWLSDWRRRRKGLGRSCSLPGAYARRQNDVVWSAPAGKRIGGKPLGLMREVVRDYALPGEVVGDTHAGHATTILAALMEGCSGVGAERDPSVHAEAVDRIRGGFVVDMFAGLPAAPGWST